MPNRQIGSVIEKLRAVVLVRDGAGLTDGQLLDLFLTSHEAAALEALIRRHAHMVWDVCRRLLRNHHDAEDAFQATFLVLVRKASSVKPREMVGNWLYGVARQTALKARAIAGKRSQRERQVMRLLEPMVIGSEERQELRTVLDRELSRLPDKYRVLIVLCDLEGRTRKEVAEQLRVPMGTVAGRLTRAHTMLAKSLRRHRLTVSTATLAALLCRNLASACVPAPLVSSTIQAACQFALGTGAISMKTIGLMEGVLQHLLITKIKIAAIAVMVSGLIGFGAFSFGYHGRQVPGGSASSLPVTGALSTTTTKEKEGVAEKPQERKSLELDLVNSDVGMQMIAHALGKYIAANGHYPPAAICNKQGQPLLSWRVALLPYFSDGGALYKEFKLDQPWDSSDNKKILAKRPTYYDFVPGLEGQPSMTYYQVFVGNGTVFEPGKLIDWKEIPDGTSATIAVVEGAEAVPWTKPADLAYDKNKSLPRLGGHFPSGFLAVFADMSVWFIKQNFDESLMRAAITRNGREIVDLLKLRDFGVR
jgi:RNA polymerase sigma factor (sigma-70 family)